MARNKMTTCRFCGAEIAASARTCPHCGGKNKKPVYMKWWFWVLIVLVVFSVIPRGGRKTDKPDAGKTETVTAAPTAKPTAKPTAEPTPTAQPIPDREEIKGFDEASNQVVEIGGVRFQLPGYLERADDGSNGSLNYAYNDGENALVLNLYAEDFTAEQFAGKREEIQDSIIKSTENAKLVDGSDMTIGSMTARIFRATFGENEDMLAKILLIYNPDSGKAVKLMAIEGLNAPKTFSSDINKIYLSADKSVPEASASVPAPAESTPAASEEPSGVTPEFKKTMDDYEAFFNEYAEFMKRYSHSDDAMSMLNDYLSMLTRYSEAMDGLDAIDESKLSAADAAYYTEVMLRINAKILEAANAMQ